MATLTFLGAARTVTGSKHLLEVDGLRVLIDCGLFQGLKDLRTRNWSPFAVRPDTIDCVVLTHAHIDHTGWLPRLVAQGFTGPVYCTEGTADLCSLVLPDAAHLQEEDARFANKRGYSRHHPALPLYTEADAAEALSLLRRSPFGRKIAIG
jgi:metallo-beta-lactamase family protein